MDRLGSKAVGRNGDKERTGCVDEIVSNLLTHAFCYPLIGSAEASTGSLSCFSPSSCFLMALADAALCAQPMRSAFDLP